MRLNFGDADHRVRCPRPARASPTTRVHLAAGSEAIRSQALNRSFRAEPSLAQITANPDRGILKVARV